MSSMRKSARGQVDPFIVMDVMEAAAQAEAAGRHIIHMEVGQPSTPAPLGARRALAAGCERLDWGVKDDNVTAIAFYERLGAQAVTGSRRLFLDGAGLRNLLA